MEHKEKGDNLRFTAVIRIMLMSALFSAVLLFAGNSVYADSDIVLTVQKDGKSICDFTMQNLQDIATEEGSKSYSYSAWDSTPAFYDYTGIAGASVEGILTSAGVMDDVSPEGTIQFRNTSGDTACLTGKQLFEEERYFYPNGDEVRHRDGFIPDEAYSDSEVVKAIISTDKNGNYGLYVGQAAPNEENKELYINNMASGGTINVSTKRADQCKQIDTDPVKQTAWRPGKLIKLMSQDQSAFERDKEKIYYTLDSSMSPGYNCPIYNYGLGSEDISNPVFPELPEGTPKERSFIYLKTIVKAYGKLDSKPQGFTFYVGDALTVKVDGVTVAAYEPDDFSNFPVIEEMLNYSGYNSYPTFQPVSTEKAYEVKGIVEYATGKDISEFSEDSKIKFSAWDGYNTELTFRQIFGTERYYFPNAEAGTDKEGGAAYPAAYEGKVEVPAVIDAGGKNTLMFGQVAPNEQNHSEYVSSMFTLGEIDITTTPAEQCSIVLPDDYEDGAVVASGTEIHFPFPDEAHKRDKIYYIVDPAEGEIPGEGCAFYYYAANRWPKELVNSPVLNGTGVHTIAAKVVSYGKKDSEVYTLRYSISPQKPTGVSAKASAYNMVSVSWRKQTDASGYRIYRSAGSTSPELIATLGPGAQSFTDSNLNTGTIYHYHITAYATGEGGEVIESECSETVSVKPSLSEPTLKLKSGKRKATVKWSKISGASGYQIYRSTKKSSGFKKVKTVTKGKTVSYTNKKLKKGKYYYFKVRAYRTVSGKKVYSAFSSVKRVKIK